MDKSKIQLLVVDDSAFMRSYLKRLLIDSDFEVMAEASSGEEAIAIYERCQPDLVILDITLPKMDGIETLRKIIQLDPQAKVVMCSSLGQKYLIEKALKIGAKDFIVKPYFDQFISVLNNVITK
ncbi:response regulator [Bacillus chungangensis]|uniref:Two-component system chemotaxis response regulator CheY n=1 Tax=Bacillus chungangensis TaxID=587633 RepID=A0ABT9WMU9_9BACI|nr:response regulator [Bacillus chungangensis]MDQ0174591.1 two-component system chemotaxis response regulator CheY [Bacillus chungangensis]